MERDIQLLRDRTSWDEALREVCTGRGVRTVFQPIVNIENGEVVGYEALSRFDSPIEATPDRWFAEADSRGLGHEIEAVALARALSARADLPPGCFLSLNVGPDALASEPVQRVLDSEGDLDGIVLELTEHAHVADYSSLGEVLDVYRRRGAQIAVDDAGAGYSGLKHIVAVKPSILKLDRSLIAELDKDDVKRSLVEMLATFAHRIGARLVAEGIERPEELETLQTMGVPLAQGFFLAMPAPTFARLQPQVRDACGPGRARRGGTTVRSAMELIAWVEEPNLDRRPAGELAVVIGANRRPLGFVDPAQPGAVVAGRTISADAALSDAAVLAIKRPHEERLRPLLCVDASGRYVGVARVERVIERLCNLPA